MCILTKLEKKIVQIIFFPTILPAYLNAHHQYHVFGDQNYVEDDLVGGWWFLRSC